MKRFWFVLLWAVVWLPVYMLALTPGLAILFWGLSSIPELIEKITDTFPISAIDPAITIFSIGLHLFNIVLNIALLNYVSTIDDSLFKKIPNRIKGEPWSKTFKKEVK